MKIIQRYSMNGRIQRFKYNGTTIDTIMENNESKNDQITPAPIFITLKNYVLFTQS